MEPAAKADEQATIEDINILAVWDGNLSHAVQVNICVKVSSESGQKTSSSCLQVNFRQGTRQTLMHRSDELVEDASVTEIRETKLLNAETGTQREPQRSDDPRITATQQPFEDWNLKTPHKHRLAKFYRAITSARSFSAAAAAERWQEIKEEDCSRSSVSGYPNTDDGYAQLDRINSQHRQPTRVDPSTSINMMQINPAPSSVPSTSTTSPVSDCSSPSRVNDSKYRTRVLPSSYRKSQYPSELLTYEGMEDLRTRIRLGLPLPVWDVLPENRPIRKASPKASTKKPWIPPALSDLSSHNKVKSSPNSGTKSARHLRNQSLEAKSTGTKETLDTSVPGKHSSRRQPPQTISGSTNRNGATVYNWIKSPNDSRVKITRSTMQRQSELPETSIERDSRDLPEACHRRYTLGSASPSPPVSPRQWLRHRSASAQHFKYFPPTSRGTIRAPTWVIEDGKLCIIFPEDVRPGTFEIDIQAKIRLSPPISPYRHSFSIPGLMRGTQNRIPTGNFSFFIERPEWIPGSPQLRLATENLMDWRVKESSHAIGRFHLDASPTLLVRLKAPVFHVLDFSAAVEMCTSVVSMTERKLGLSYRVKIVSEISDTDIFADRVDLFLVVRNGLLESVEYQTQTGTCTTLHESILGPTGKKENEALLKITRDLKDLRADIDISFTVPYRIDSGIIPYPTVRPLFGDVVSETIIITCPRLPLILEHVPQVQSSSWEALHYNERNHAMIRLDRVQKPKCFPEGLRDDPFIRVSELDRVSFRGLKGMDAGLKAEQPIHVARDLHFALHDIPGGQINCRISVDVEIGQNDKILVIDPQGWNPCYSLIDGQLATELCGQWRKTKDNFLALFREDLMSPGKIVHIVFQFQRHVIPEASEKISGIDAPPFGLTSDGVRLALPKIIGKTSLGTIIKSDLEHCTFCMQQTTHVLLQLTSLPTGTVHLVDQPEHQEISQTLSRTGLTEMHLPRLTPSYHLFIGLAKPFGDTTTPPKPVTGPANSSSSELGTIPSQADDRATNRVRFANLVTTNEPLTAANQTPDDSVVAEIRIDPSSSGLRSEASTDCPKNATTMEKAATTTVGKHPATTGLLSWVVKTVIVLIVYLACIYLETGFTSMLAPSSNSYADTDFSTGSTSSLYESSQGIHIDPAGASEYLYEEPVDVIAASSKDSGSESVEQDQVPARPSEKRMLDIIDRALGWKGQ